MDLTYAPPLLAPEARRTAWTGERWLRALGVCLLGYALLGRAFAYVGVPPLFVGEVLLAAGIAVALSRSRLLAPLAALPLVWALLALQAWAAARTLPFLGTHGLDAVRDWMTLGYATFAYLVAALVLARPERLREGVLRYRRFVAVMLALAWAAYVAFKVFESSLPWLPWAVGQARVVEAKGGDLMVHVSAMAAFLVLGLMRPRPLAVAALAATAGLVMVSNRGGMIAFALTLALAWALRPPGAHFGKLAYAFVLFLALGLLAGPLVQIHGGTRNISVEQLWTNVTSIVDQSDSASLETTKTWRLAWWAKIVGYTFGGEHFWGGKGFGVNLAVDDGFQTSEDASLRSPHNGHLTILARMGVPAFALWLALHLGWLAGMLRAWWAARLAGQAEWMAVLAFLVCYWTAIQVNGLFEVYFEGPMGGVWLWSVFGAGLAAVRLHARHPDVLAPRAPEAPVPAVPWTWSPPAAPPRPAPPAHA